MKSSEKAAWIAALRSGEYQQATGQLCKIAPDGSKSYCCLGVYFAAVKHIDVPDYGPGDNNVSVVVDSLSPPHLRNTALYNELRKAIKWAPDTPHLAGGITSAVNPTGVLAFANDAGGASFSQIADFIEQWLIADDPEDSADAKV